VSGDATSGRPPFTRAVVIGLGLIGGSVARDLAARGVHVSAYDADERQLDAALDELVVAERLDAGLAGVRAADLVVVAVPVDRALGVLERIAPQVMGAGLVTDVGSTKQAIVASASTLGLSACFVGSHPMTGDHRSGWSASRAGLFEGARVYLCPGADTPAPTVDRAASLWRWLGAVPASMRADEHDRHLAWTSHLPHIISTTLALALADGRVRREDLGPGGRDMTRLAGSSAEMWTAIAGENAAAIDAALAAAERHLAEFRDLLQRPDAARLHERFAGARAWFEA
jgi:prephenate dehydrogenase